MSLFKSLINIFSSSQNHTADANTISQEEYKGFLLVASPMEEGSQFRINGLISKDDQEHVFMRADVLPSSELCVQETFRKAKMMIDQQGNNIFQS